MADDKSTFIDPQADVEGTLKGKDAQILGRFRGEVNVSGRLVLGEGARVDAKVAADAVEIAGEFKGEIKARKAALSSMPEDLVKQLSKRDLRDLIEFLAGLK